MLINCYLLSLIRIIIITFFAFSFDVGVSISIISAILQYACGVPKICFEYVRVYLITFYAVKSTYSLCLAVRLHFIRVLPMLRCYTNYVHGNFCILICIWDCTVVNNVLCIVLTVLCYRIALRTGFMNEVKCLQIGIYFSVRLPS